MTLHDIVMDGRKYVMIPRDEWDRLAKHLPDPDLLPLPSSSADGSFSVDHVRVSLCNKVIRQRKNARLTQAQLAKRAGIRIETISRLESGKHIPSVRTMEKIEAAIAGSKA
jgi:DNA-binding XRE family transcriptional regulator